MTLAAPSVRRWPFQQPPPMILRQRVQSGSTESTLAPPAPDTPSSSAFSAETEPLWQEHVFARMEELISLPEDWDTHGGRPLRLATALFALQILIETLDRSGPRPQIFPASYGGVQIEWHEQGIDIEVEVIAPHEVLVTFEDAVTGDEEAFPLSTDLSRLSDLLGVLTARAAP